MKLVERLFARLDRIEETLARNTASLEEHVRRTNLLEEEIKPIKKHVTYVNAGAKILSVGLTLLLAAHSLGIFK